MMNFSIYWWTIPTLITALCFGWAIFIYDDGGGMFSGMGNMFMLIPASFISMVSWIICAVFK
jgi:hypothetical protein